MCPQRIQGLERQLSAAEHAVESAHDAAVAQTEEGAVRLRRLETELGAEGKAASESMA